MKTYLTLIILITSSCVLAGNDDVDKNTQSSALNLVKSTEQLDARLLYATKLDATLTKELSVIKKQNMINEAKGISAKKSTKKVKVSYRPNIRVVALYEGGAIVNQKGFRRTVTVNDYLGAYKVTEITAFYLKVENKSRTYKYSIK